jgi:hypothetical protein
MANTGLALQIDNCRQGPERPGACQRLTNANASLHASVSLAAADNFTGCNHGQN